MSHIVRRGGPMAKFEFPFKTCFVITPYGRRPDDRPSAGGPGKEIDFEQVYREIIAPALEPIVPITGRSKDRTISGVVHEDMFRQILTADIVLADITLLNANALYELGVRHAARPSGTIILQQVDSGTPPFNLNSTRVVRYPNTARAAGAAETAIDPQLCEEAQDLIRRYVRHALSTRRTDSPIHSLIPNLNIVAPAKPIGTVALGLFDVGTAGKRVPPTHATEAKATPRRSLQADIDTHSASHTSAKAPRPVERKIGVAIGNLRDLYDVAEVWVNPENTRMEMGPMFGETVSSYIRVLSSGARDGTFGDDRVQRSLKTAMGRATTLAPGFALTTWSPKAFKADYGVRAIVHVAAQEGFPLGGFTTVKQVGQCVVAALEEVERQNRSLSCRLGIARPLRSVLIPLFGTRNPGVSPVDVTTELVLAAKRHLDLEASSVINCILFLASTDHDLELCELAFRRLKYPFETITWSVRSHGVRWEYA
jgi:hypothetical protein